MQAICCRPARAEDIPLMIALLEQLFALEADFTPSAARQEQGLRLLLQAAHAVVFVAEMQGIVVGMVTGQLVISTAEGGPAVLVEDLFVADEARGRGAGAALLGHVAQWARQHGAERLQLLADHTNSGALRFYEATGWRRTQLVCLRRSAGTAPLPAR